MNGNGYCSECGKYAQTLGHLPDGTEVYRCYECGHMWAERLVVFDVSFALAERKVDDGPPACAHVIALAVESVS